MKQIDREAIAMSTRNFILNPSDRSAALNVVGIKVTVLVSDQDSHAQQITLQSGDGGEMPRYSDVTFSVQPVGKVGRPSGIVVSGFLSKKQLETLREFVDHDEHQRSKKWRGEYQEMAKAIVGAIDGALPKR